MASLAATDKILAVTCGSHVLGVKMNEVQLNVIEVPGLKTGRETVDSGRFPLIEETTPYVLGAALSRCSRWMALCSSDKQLGLWETSNWSLVSNWVLAKSAEKVKFVPSSRALVVADRSGDAYLFSVLEPHVEGKLLLGHLSMLLDVLVSDNEDFIITCDRDEKIRVSHFPNSYNIQSYCLGHTEFVSCISFLSHQPCVLLSGSGDGTLRFWDYMTGTQKKVVKCHKEVKEYNMRDLSSKNTELSLDEVVAVTQVSSCLLSSSSSTVVACVSSLKGCIVYSVMGDTNSLVCSFNRTVQFTAAPWDVHLVYPGFLWILVNSESEPLELVYLDRDLVGDLNSHSKVKQTIGMVNEQRQFFINLQPAEMMSILYKRKFDNVQKYFARKKARLAPVV